METSEELAPQGEWQCPGPLVFRPATGNGPEFQLGDGCHVRDLRGEALRGGHIAVQTVTPTPEHVRRAIAQARERRRRESE